MLWFLERAEAMHTENPLRGTAEAGKKATDEKKIEKRSKRTTRTLTDELRCSLTC